MMIGITGTPGTGKSTISKHIQIKTGIPVLDLKNTVGNYIIEHDTRRDTDVIDIDAWSRDFKYVDGFVEGSIAHYLPCDKIVVLRCRPDILRHRLMDRGYTDHKINENCQAEALDVILSETVNMFESKQIYEIDTTNNNIESIVNSVLEFVDNKISSSFGLIDWSDYLDPNILYYDSR